VDKIVYVDRPYEVQTIKEVPIERIVKQEVLVEVPGPERIIKHIQAHCNHEHCDSFLTLDGKCPVCPLKSRLSQPQAPSIAARDTFCKPCSDGFEWADNISKTTVVQVVHPQRDGWQKHLPVTLYVTLNGSQPSEQNYAHKGPPPLEFSIPNSMNIKAVALTGRPRDGASTTEMASFKRLSTSGVGMLLEKHKGYHGIYVKEVTEFGAVWEDNNIKVTLTWKLSCTCKCLRMPACACWTCLCSCGMLAGA
jgi:hypothetical protein